MTAGVISAHGIGRRLGGKWAVRDASLTLQPGRIIALLGPSGSGKTTLLRMLAGLEPVDQGEIRRGGDVISAPGHTLVPEKRGCGLVFQDFALFPHLRARENVAFGLDRRDKAAALARAQAWLDRVGLGNRAGAFPYQLSGGEQQRVALARALAPEPRAILLDEPFSGLAPELRAELRDWTADILRACNASALIVTHDAGEAQILADEIAILHAGRILQIGDPRELWFAPSSPEVATALGPVNIWQGRVVGGAFVCPFGTVALPTRNSGGDLAEGASVTLCVRAEGIVIDPEGITMRVLTRRPQGALAALGLSAPGLSIPVRALLPWSRAPAPGEAVRMGIDPELAFVFPDPGVR